MRTKDLFNRYMDIVIVFWVMSLALRLIEAVTIMAMPDNAEGVLVSEAAGLAMDIVFESAILLLLFPFYGLIARRAPKTATTIYLVTFGIFVCIHVLLLQYYFNQHKPLDALLFGYSPEEIIMTVGTADVPVVTILIELAASIVVIVSAYLFVRKKSKPKILAILTMLSLPIAVALLVLDVSFYNDFAANKSFYFYEKAASYTANKKQYCHEISREKIAEYHKLFPNKKFVSDEYPLLHEFTANDSLSAYFNDFDSKPNVVIIIVEGLNDDFVHGFHGLNLMPKLHSLIGKSLYWDHCFTLGERSYAVVPSLLGSLPYGEMGFTLLNRLPRHVTLMSILKAHGYQTDFFYGQGSWFHRKDRFFKRNNIDLIFDNAVYDEKYNKIIVGENNFFWGYNDRDMFNQSLEVIDTTDRRPRMDVYFTGSMHSPFIIPEPEHYNRRLDSLKKNLERKDRKYYDKYNDYAMSIMFFDDALADYLERYSRRDDWQNTIFVITGDHPMSEIPPENALKKYHVPLIIYSPRLKTPAVFNNTVSHLDFLETMIAYMERYGIKKPAKSPAFGGNLFDNNDNFAFMDEPRNVIEFYSNGYYLQGDKLYKVEEDYNIHKINDSDKCNELKRKLELVRDMSEYTSIQNYIIPADEYCKMLGQNLITDLDHSGDTSSNAKYIPIIYKTDVTDCDTVTLDLSFAYKGDGDNTVVCEMNDENNNNLYYGANYIGNEEAQIEIYKHLQVKKGEGRTYLKVYLYNKKEGMCHLTDINGMLSSNSTKQ